MTEDMTNYIWILVLPSTMALLPRCGMNIQLLIRRLMNRATGLILATKIHMRRIPKA